MFNIPVASPAKEPAKKEKIKTIFVQKGFPQSAAKSLAKELGANVDEINHLSEHYADEMRKIARQISQIK